MQANEPPPPTIRDRPDIDELVNSLVGSGTSSQASRPESVMSSSGMSDNESLQIQQGKRDSFAQGNFTAMLLPPIVDIKPPPPMAKEEVVMYNKEVQTSVWVPEEDSEEESEEQVKRRIEEEVRREIDKLRIEEEREKLELQKLMQVEKEVPGIYYVGIL
jgi:hypothetical protein